MERHEEQKVLEREIAASPLSPCRKTSYDSVEIIQSNPSAARLHKILRVESPITGGTAFAESLVLVRQRR